MFNNGFELSVEVNGRNIPEFGKNGRTYVEGRRNHKYQIRLRNSRAERVLVVPTVDGLSVVDGQPHHENSPGYIVQAYSSLTISGWRTSLSEVRSFEFSDKGSSYAGKTAGQQNCGVIGATVFSERVRVQDIHIHHFNWPPPVIYTAPPTPPYTIWQTPHTYGNVVDDISLKCSDNASGPVGRSGPEGSSGVNINMMQCSLANSAPDFNLGTTYGAPVVDNVTMTSFDKGICLASFEIYYSDRDGLMKDGIQVDKAPELASFPQAFGGFCKLPV